MASIKSIPLSGLLSSQQIVEFGTKEIYQFFGQIEKDFNEGLVSKSYFEKSKNNIGQRIQDNNEISDAIEKEMFLRIQKAFGQRVTTPKIMHSLVAEYEKEKLEYANLLKDKKVIPLDLTPSNEKVHDKK
jgi:hypothetical protein